MPAPVLISQLVQRFAESLPACRFSGYKEANLCLEYIDLSFDVLVYELYGLRRKKSESWKAIHKGS